MHDLLSERRSSGQHAHADGSDRKPGASHDYLPFGEEIGAGFAGRKTAGTWGFGDWMDKKFTGKERDAESGLDYFGARHYGSALGRFVNPDWDGTPQPIPYAGLPDPQTLNLYGYVRDNPLSKPDLDGHQVPPEAEESPEEVERDNAEFESMAREVDAHVRAQQRESLSPPERAAADKLADHYTQHLLGPLYDEIKSAASDPGPYKRPSNATTPEQRASVQNQPCAMCGAQGQKNNADHKEPLVVEYYRNGGKIDNQRMRGSNAVQPQCQNCSNQQGAYLSSLSKMLTRIFGYTQ